jgi:opacity protein-like surface antigen
MTLRHPTLLAAATSAIIASLALPGLASAAPASDWSGFYVGAKVGGGIASNGVEDKDCFFCASDNANTAYGVVGGQVGFNHQIGAAVLGGEADVYWSSFDHKGALGLDDGERINPDQMKMDVYGSIRARAGLTVDNALIYVTAGPAWGSQQNNSHVVRSTGTVVGDITDNSTHWGVAAGAGVEIKTSENLSLVGEFIYTGYEDKTVDGSSVLGCSGNFSCRIGYRLNTEEARVGFNYHFH